MYKMYHLIWASSTLPCILSFIHVWVFQLFHEMLFCGFRFDVKSVVYTGVIHCNTFGSDSSMLRRISFFSFSDEALFAKVSS